MRDRLGTDETFMICNSKLNRKEDDDDVESSSAFVKKDRQSMPEQIDCETSCKSKDCESLETLSETNTTLNAEETDCHDSVLNAQDTTASNDDDTVVSSLSKDEDCLILPTMAAALRRSLKPIMETRLLSTEKAPPNEVSFENKHVKEEETVVQDLDSQQEDDSSSQTSTGRMDKLIENLALNRSSTEPTLYSDNSQHLCAGSVPRHLPKPSTISRRSISLPLMKSDAAGNNTSSCSKNALHINGTVVKGLRPRYNCDAFYNYQSDNVNHPHAALVGDRKQRRLQNRSISLGGPEISVGNLVGQSTLLASSSPLAAESDDASSVRRALLSASEVKKKMLRYDEETSDGSACCQVRRPQNMMKKELKFMVSKVTTPLRAVKLVKVKKVDLKRSSNGCLV